MDAKMATPLDRLFSTPRKQRLDSTMAQISLIEAYEETMNFHDYGLETTSPLSLVMDAPAEDVSTKTLLLRYTERYHSNNIQKHFGLSLLEFLDCPFYYAEELLELSSTLSGAEHRVLQDIASRLENEK